MLVLKRAVGERIRILVGDAEVWVTLVDVRPGAVRLGIDAPREAAIDRAELLPDGGYRRPAPATGGG